MDTVIHEDRVKPRKVTCGDLNGGEVFQFLLDGNGIWSPTVHIKLRRPVEDVHGGAGGYGYAEDEIVGMVTLGTGEVSWMPKDHEVRRIEGEYVGRPA